MNLGGEDGTASQEYWTKYAQNKGVEDAYIEGGTIQITASDMGVKLYTDFGFVHNGYFMQYIILRVQYL